jgi:serine/threonine-protein kinase
MAEHGQILVSQRTVTKLRNAVKTEFVKTCDIGTQPIKVYEVEYEKPPDQEVESKFSGRRAARNERSLVSGVAISHYRIIEKLGEGGMGEVYKAEDLKLNRTVALKILPSSGQDEEIKRRFVREARSLSALNHPNIATIYEIDEHNGVNFIAMEYIAGRTLKALLDTETLSLARILDLAIPVAEALRTAHDKNIIHRDIKPTNIMASDIGYIKVLDFGLATLAAPPETDDANTPTNMLTHVGEMCGTVGYMSPEQAMGVKLDQRSDIFSFGVVLYELITGRQPFAAANPMAVLHSIIFDNPPPISRLRPDAAGELEVIVNKALQKKANERYQSLKEALADLRRLRNDISRAAGDYL